jgi:hypothetical protein
MYWCGVPSLTRSRACSFQFFARHRQSSLSQVWVQQDSWAYFIVSIFETPPTWIYIPQDQGRPDILYMYNLNYTPKTLEVWSWREITSGGTSTRNGHTTHISLNPIPFNGAATCVLPVSVATVTAANVHVNKTANCRWGMQTSVMEGDVEGRRSKGVFFPWPYYSWHTPRKWNNLMLNCELICCFCEHEDADRGNHVTVLEPIDKVWLVRSVKRSPLFLAQSDGQSREREKKR